MQEALPSVMDISGESSGTLDLYGIGAGQSDGFGRQCLLARRLAEAGVRFIQLTDDGWDHHGGLATGIPNRCAAIDRPIAGLLTDLRQRGLLEDTLVVWGGEFGRTPMMENRSGRDNPFVGRDHHTDAFTVWMAGGGIQGGLSYGETDDIGYYGVKDRVHVHDLQATILHCLGIDHQRLTYHFQGRDFRLTDQFGNVVRDVLV